jgi:thiopurine S-methyltransferase
MQPDFWHARWRSGQTGFHQDTVNRDLKAHAEALLGGGQQRVLVPLCGKSRDLDWIAARGHRVVGTELSPLAARQLFEDAGRQPTVTDDGPIQRWQHDNLTVLVGDMLTLTDDQLGRFDRVWDRAALIALPVSMRQTYSARLLAALRDDGAILLSTLRHDRSRSGPPHSVTDQEVADLYGAAATLERLSTRNVLEEEPRWKQAGATELVVTSWWIQRSTP